MSASDPRAEFERYVVHSWDETRFSVEITQADIDAMRREYRRHTIAGQMEALREELRVLSANILRALRIRR